MDKLNELQIVELDLLKVLLRVCKQEKFTWYAMFGTLLGTVRHGGFIPWDDDIDVAMPRRDYDRLRYTSDLFCEPYFLQTPQNDPAAAPRFMRLRRSDTAVMKNFPSGLTRGGHMGAYIDILPLDDVPNAKQAKQMHNVAMRMQKQMQAAAAMDENAGGEMPDWKAEYCYCFGGIAGSYALLAERYELFCAKYRFGPYYAIPVLSGVRGCRVYDKQWFQSHEMMTFEGIAIPVPAGWREVLVAAYPNGLLEPDKDEHKSNEYDDKIIIDTCRSYKHYVSCYTDMLMHIEDKQVMIFGAGDSLRIWLERYAHGIDVVCAFDNDSTKWGTVAYGIPVRSPAELPMIINKDTRLIVASVWYREIACQLERMGIRDFFVFIDGLNYKR